MLHHYSLWCCQEPLKALEFVLLIVYYLHISGRITTFALNVMPMTKYENDTAYIDLARIIAESNSTFLKKLPSFVVTLLTKIVKQKELNHVLTKYADYSGVDFLPKMLQELNLKLEIEGLENLPESGRCFFAANHPFGIVDGLVLTHTVSQKYGSLKAIGNEAFMFIPHLRPIIAAVNVFGRSPKEYLQALDDTFNSEIPITHFPAGLISRRIDGKIQDPEWQKSFITKSISSKRDIVPFYFHGRNSILFYAIDIVRQWFGIRIKIELILLSREMFRKRNHTIRVRIGKPIPYQTFDDKHNHRDWTKKVREHVYSLSGSGNSKSPLL
jgi:putative hemolysin